MPNYNPTNEMHPTGGKRPGAGRKPNLTDEQQQTNNDRWGETVIAATMRIRDLMMNKRWDYEKITPAYKFRLEMAWRIIDKHFPTTSPMQLGLSFGSSSEEMVKAFIKIREMSANPDAMTKRVIDVDELANSEIVDEK